MDLKPRDCPSRCSVITRALKARSETLKRDLERWQRGELVLVFLALNIEEGP